MTLLVTGFLGAGAWLGTAALSVGTGYKAKTLCSAVFVSRLQPAAALANLQSDDLAILRFIEASVDTRARSVSTSVAGVFHRRAVYREGLGCALALDGFEPPRLPDTARPQPVLAAPDESSIISKESNAACEPLMAHAFSEPEPERRRRTLAVVVMQHGRIVCERYADGVTYDTPLPGWSMAKSVINGLVGILVRDGRLALNEPAHIAQWQAPGDRRASITLDQLLRMSSGLRFDDGMRGPGSDVMRMLFAAGDAGAFAARSPLSAPPGTRWHYSNGTTNLITSMIRNTLGSEAEYLAFPRRALFDRIGMSSAVLETDAAGTFVGSSYMYATARDWARFGTLYLQDGAWNGERILPEGWVAYTTSAAPADPSRRYGAHFWIQIPPEYAGKDPVLPVPAFHAAGHEGQFVTIVPSRGLVIVRLGRTRYPELWDHAAFVREVLAAFSFSLNTRSHLL